VACGFLTGYRRQAYNARMDAKRVVLAVIAPIAALAVIGIGRPVPAATRCEASVHAQLSHVERKELVTTQTYAVEVSTQEPCATVHFALYTSERISKKKVKVVKTADEVRVRDGSISRILHYDMPNGRELVGWEVKLTGCERCEP
jgi:hypothetical protein